MQNYRQQFDELLVLRAFRQSEIIQVEKRPSWVFWLMGTTKYQFIMGLHFDLRAIEYRIEELRLLILSPSPNGTKNRETTSV